MRIICLLSVLFPIWAGYAYEVPPGWLNDFAAATNEAARTHKPLVLYWGNQGCTQCDAFTLTVKGQNFREWMAQRPYIFCYTKGSNHADDPDNPGSRDFARTAAGKREGLSAYPFICLYRVKENGDIQAKNFSGVYTRYYMPIYKETFWESISATIDDYFASYLAGDELHFHVADTEMDRLEAEPDTKWIDVPVSRRSSAPGVSSSKLRVNFSDGPKIFQTIVWDEGETNKLVRVNLDVEGFVFQAGKRISLTLYNQQDEEQAKTYIYQVAEKENGPVNPYWIGERTVDTLQFGEWTMDLDAATNLAARTQGASTLVFFTGALWCPHCRPLESEVLESERFRNWARTNKVALVTIDNPRRSPNDNFAQYAANGYGDVSSVPNGAAPTLLRFVRDTRTGASGASYRTRKMIGEAEAEAVLRRNHELGYPGGYFHAPSSFRTGYPTLILLGGNGKIRGRFTANESAERTYDLNENMARFEEFLTLASTGTPDDSYTPTTSLSHRTGQETDLSLSIHQAERVYRLENLRAGRLSVNTVANSSSNTVVYRLERLKTISLRRRGTDGEIVETVPYAVSETVAEGTGSLEHEVSGNETYHLRVSSFADAATAFYCSAGRDTVMNVRFGSSVTIRPEDDENAETAAAGTYRFLVEEGSYYRFSGFSGVTGAVESVAGEPEFYLAVSDGIAECVATNGAEIAYRIWKPGEIAFAEAQQRVVTADGTATVRVVRIGGFCGAARVLVTANGSAVATNRCEWTDVELTFAPGETEKKIVFALLQAQTARPDEKLALSLTRMDAGVLTPAVSGMQHVLTICDTTEPSFPQDVYTLDCWKRFDAADDFALRNIDGDASLLVTSGKLPPGLSFTGGGGSVRLEGLPTKAGTYTFTCLVRDRENGKTESGRTATFTVTVRDPSDVNEFVGRALPERTVILRPSGNPLAAGELTVSVTSKNKVSAKYRGTESKSVTFSGLWQEIDPASGTVSCVLVRGAHTLALELDPDGRLHAEFTPGTDELSYFAGAGEALTGAAEAPEENVFADFKGGYTVQLPVADSDGKITGGGFLHLRMTSASAVRKGRVSYAGYLPDGRALSGSAQLTGIDAKGGRLAVFKRAAPSVAGVELLVLRGVREAWDSPGVIEAQQLIQADPDSTAYHLRRDGNGEISLNEMEAWGGAYEAVAAERICRIFGYRSTCNLAFDASGFEPGIRGGIALLPSAVATARGNGFRLSEKTEGMPLSISFSKSTGQFNGRAAIRFDDGTKTTGTYRGILLPGWASCGDCGFDIVTRPLGYGTLWFKE